MNSTCEHDIIARGTHDTTCITGKTKVIKR